MIKHISSRFQLVILLIILLPCWSAPMSARENISGHRITVKITNCSDSLFYLNHYSSDEITNDDTARLNPAGYFVFQGNDTLEDGLYFISSNSKTRYFDFFITGNQQITLECDLSNVIKTLKTTDSHENQIYYTTLLLLQSNLREKDDAYQDSIQYLLDHTDFSLPIMQQIFGKQNDKLSLSEKYIKACISPSIFQKYFIRQGNKKNETSVPFYLGHYFDNLDFSDDRLINTPVLTQKMDEFVDTLSGMPELTIQENVDHLITLSSINKKTQEFIVWHLASRYETYYFLQGYDAIYVHIVNDFLVNGKVAWYFPELKERELSQVNKFESLLNGKVGPDLEMPDTSFVIRDLYSIKVPYTLLLFWASTCSHCRDEMPSIIQFYKDFHKKYELEIFGVSTDTSATRWKSYVRRHKLEWINVFGRKNIHGSYHTLYNIQSTPTLLLLDDKKKIIAKYLKPEQFGEIIKNLEEQKRKDLH